MDIISLPIDFDIDKIDGRFRIIAIASQRAKDLASRTRRLHANADARASFELITAIYHSARTRQTVELPIETGHPLYAGWQPE